MAKAKWNYQMVRDAQQNKAANFTWYETYTNVLDAIPVKPAKALMALAIIEYGAYGKEPNFDKDVTLADGTMFPAAALQAIFEANRINIENSVVQHFVSHLGGRPSKAERAQQAKAKKNNTYESEVPADVFDDAIEAAIAEELNGMPDPARGEVPVMQVDYEFDECPL